MTLPALVHDLALRLGASLSRIGGPVTQTRTGSMKLKLDSDLWLPFAAQVAWVIGGQRRHYWRGALSTWSLGSPVPASDGLRQMAPSYLNRSPALPVTQGQKT